MTFSEGIDSLAIQLHGLTDKLIYSVGTPVMPLSTAINLQKCTTLPFCMLLCAYYNNWGDDALLYTALHGSYGLLWYLKHLAFPDPNWDRQVSFFGAAAAWICVLGPYWIAPYLLISSPDMPEASPFLRAFCVVLFSLGVSIMLVADCQKYFTLKCREKKELISNGMFALVRSPSYTGEMMLYASFALLARHLVPFLVLLIVWTTIFVPNIVTKEKSMSRYPQWKAYTSRTKVLIPHVI
eukprot:TRINITY_DN9155_c0_g1_i1.p1 TRINITY_DN9155_c0_g1~~TRINITY_DN9155_c0_g1_i1.p1  ORF type:complete len:239 (-),score=16.46 TRINITY_DN9155_c0_g1_i1:25-741(-)